MRDHAFRSAPDGRSYLYAMPMESLFRVVFILLVASAGIVLRTSVVYAQDSSGAPTPAIVAPGPAVELVTPRVPEQEVNAVGGNEMNSSEPVRAGRQSARLSATARNEMSNPATTSSRFAQPRDAGSLGPSDSLAIPRGAVRDAFQRILIASADSSGPLSQIGPLPPMAAVLRGMVWQPPDSLHIALDNLLAMRRMGVQVIRTPVIRDTLLLRAGDVLDIAFYQDLPIANLPAQYLLDTLRFAERTLTEMLRNAQRYRSARHFGLAKFADTSNPASRPYFERLTQLIRTQGPEGSQAYYLSRFPDDDRCDQTVDFVLLDARQDDPLSVLERWRHRSLTPVGIGAFGAPVRPGKRGGWREIGTLAAQARTFENGLGRINALSILPQALFIYRWTDAGSRIANMDQRAAVEGFVYGLHGAKSDSLARPALDVVRGFFTGTQRVFAFDAGRTMSATRTAAGMVFVGWLLLMGMGMVYWLTPRFGSLSSKYFTRHDLYRESVQRGYDLNAGLNAMLGVALSLAGAIAGASALRALGRTDALSTAVSSWSLDAQARLNELLGEPMLLVLLIALCYSLWLLFNVFWLYVLTGRRARIRAQQALTLVVWSRWAIVLLMIWAMMLSAMSPRTATALAPLLLFAWAGIEIVATGRMLNDFAHVTRVPMQRAMLLGYGAPLAVMALILITLFVGGKAEMGFLWHLATRS